MGVCPVCGDVVHQHLGTHLRVRHGEEAFRSAVLNAKASGMPDAEIGATFGISFRQLEQMITETYGVNVSSLAHPRKKIRAWAPLDFREETTTVWSFKQRGNWATHDGRYRGNWSPYIPRNVILKYSRPGDLVLDYFVGGGTTAVEAKLLGRRCIAIDINPQAIQLTRENLSFLAPPLLDGGPVYEPETRIGDARDLSGIEPESVDLICAHPPYAGIVRYSAQVEGDLSSLPVPQFLEEMGNVARESWRVLKPGGKCVLLVGDTRRSRYILPIGFQTIRVFLNAGFLLKELVIKRQHNCKTTGFWYTRSLEYNFLLLAHEYLPVFEKPVGGSPQEVAPSPCAIFGEWSQGTVPRTKVENKDLETSSVWLFPAHLCESEIVRNLVNRFGAAGTRWAEVRLSPQPSGALTPIKEGDLPGAPFSLLYVHGGSEGASPRSCLSAFLEAVDRIAEGCRYALLPGGFLAVETQDLRADESLLPAGLLTVERLNRHTHLRLKEIAVVAPESPPALSPQVGLQNSLQIVHRYLLIFRREEG
ncbi:MAG: methyltransferase domain-containing protein [Thermoflexia bacterium]|nr:MAG: methyltransferase domain-containing protein [Thermoflexia bacterium]